MKKIITFCMVFVMVVSFAQTINDKPISEIDTEYIQILGHSRFLSKKVNVTIDFGQRTKYFSSGAKAKIKDKDGKFVKFNSMIDALNFMNANGYEFVQAYAFNVNNQNVYHYLMKKRK